MKKTMILFLLLVSVSFAQQTGPFGLSRGMSKEAVVAAVGAKNVIKNEGRQVSTVPKPHLMFESYSLLFSPTVGLVKILALSVIIDTDDFGDQIRSAYDDISTALQQAYGQPNYSFDFLQSGSIWHERNEFMWGLYKKERTLATAWDNTSETNGTAPIVRHALPNQIANISLQAVALDVDPNKADLILAYEFNGFNQYADEVAKKKASVF
jgi:hypothetical protein